MHFGTDISIFNILNYLILNSIVNIKIQYLNIRHLIRYEILKFNISIVNFVLFAFTSPNVFESIHSIIHNLLGLKKN